MSIAFQEGTEGCDWFTSYSQVTYYLQTLLCSIQELCLESDGMQCCWPGIFCIEENMFLKTEHVDTWARWHVIDPTFAQGSFWFPGAKCSQPHTNGEFRMLRRETLCLHSFPCILGHTKVAKRPYWLPKRSRKCWRSRPGVPAHKVEILIYLQFMGNTDTHVCTKHTDACKTHTYIQETMPGC